MARITAESSGDRERKTESGEPDFKWAVEHLVRERGQRRAAKLLGVNRKTVALALRRERLTGRMNHAVQTLLANLDDPAKQEAMPIDRIESQIGFLLEAMDEIDGLVEKLTLRVEALEVAQHDLQTEVKAGAEAEAAARGDDATVAQMHKDEPERSPQPEPKRAGRRLGWWRD